MAEDGEYAVSYFMARPGLKTVLFKKVDYPGRRRAEVFVLVHRQWEPASGLLAVMAGRPEWDPSAIPVERSELRDLLAKAGWDHPEIERALDSKDGQRLRSRKDTGAPGNSLLASRERTS
jgi:hypothetical protein